ncbi:hypothetical protein SNOD_25115 [Streptomyces nodosus]|uniref:Uncharacterized protein n=1 Tax=Streptomyces nodosus TaxID=40318 RepID=A0A0B5DNS9_9ACTN|nr:hypothetical protein SNOD_25115 [Streptomyces nodosus]
MNLHLVEKLLGPALSPAGRTSDLAEQVEHQRVKRLGKMYDLASPLDRIHHGDGGWSMPLAVRPAILSPQRKVAIQIDQVDILSDFHSYIRPERNDQLLQAMPGDRQSNLSVEEHRLS